MAGANQASWALRSGAPDAEGVRGGGLDGQCGCTGDTDGVGPGDGARSTQPGLMTAVLLLPHRLRGQRLHPSGLLQGHPPREAVPGQGPRRSSAPGVPLCCPPLPADGGRREGGLSPASSRAGERSVAAGQGGGCGHAGLPSWRLSSDLREAQPGTLELTGGRVATPCQVPALPFPGAELDGIWPRPSAVTPACSAS